MSQNKTSFTHHFRVECARTHKVLEVDAENYLDATDKIIEAGWRYDNKYGGLVSPIDEKESRMCWDCVGDGNCGDCWLSK